MKLFELYDKKPLREDKTLTACIKLCESTIAVLEASYEGGIDFEPDDSFAGVQGVSRDSGAGIQGAKAAQFKQQEAKLNQTWKMLVGKMGKLDYAASQTLKQNLLKLAGVAKSKGFTLSPSPQEVFNQ